MGYYTYYQINIEPMAQNENVTELTKKIATRLEELSGYAPESAYDGTIDVGDVKWYECEEDMYALSKEFPQVLFHVSGDGESSDDLWEDHWQDGMLQSCHAEIPPFDRNKMQQYVLPQYYKDHRGIT